jgi:hypothetical protein
VYRLLPIGHRYWDDFESFFQRRWFRRCWTLQEIAVAQAARFPCRGWGPTAIPFLVIFCVFDINVESLESILISMQRNVLGRLNLLVFLPLLQKEPHRTCSSHHALTSQPSVQIKRSQRQNLRAYWHSRRSKRPSPPTFS